MKQIALLLIVLQFVGCASHRIIFNSRPTEEDCREATVMMENREATIVTLDDRKIKAGQLDFRIDSLVYVHMQTGEMSSVPVSNLNRAIARDTKPYVRNGAIYGGIAGVGVGLIATALAFSTDTGCDDCKPDKHGEWGLLFPAALLTGGVIGAGVGALIGAAATPVYSVEYRLDK